MPVPEMNFDIDNKIDKWVIIFLGTTGYEPIVGNLRLINTFFLMAKEILDSRSFNDFQFHAHEFGPYSCRMAERINKLKANSIIKIKYNGTIGIIKYSLTHAGKKRYKKLIKQLQPSLIKNIENLKKRSIQTPLRSILKEIYRKYPEYCKMPLTKRNIHDVDLIKYEKINDGPGFVAGADPKDVIKIKNGDFLNIL
ncbi:MAG: hypothetical protein ACTSU2_05780 [Promethearchaeota archaeon]